VIFLFGTFSLDGSQRKSTSKEDSRRNSQRQLFLIFDPWRGRKNGGIGAWLSIFDPCGVAKKEGNGA